MDRDENLALMFANRVKRYSRRPCLRFKKDGLWTEMTYSEVNEFVNRFALGLIALGMEKGDRIALLSENRPKWAVSDLATLSGGGVLVSIYATKTPEQVGYVLKDCGAKICLVSNNNQLQKVLKVKGSVPSLQRIVIFDPIRDITDRDEMVITWKDALKMGDDYANPDELQQRISRISLDDLATLIYTSGTMGMPKGVMLSQNNLCSNIEAALKVIDIKSDDVALSCLPLSHSFERMAGHFTALSAGACITYVESLDLLMHNMEEVNPTVMIGVPRIYEKIHAKIIDEVQARGRTAVSAFSRALGVGREVAERKLTGRSIPFAMKAKHQLAQKVVFAPVLERFGNRLRFLVSGGAPLAPEITEFFFAIGIRLYEGYGLTETSPVVSVNSPDAVKLGTVGKPLPGVEVRIADDGEIMLRGPNVMMGYFGQPESTANVIDDQGWLYTGDIGMLDEEGFLRITDRKKDIIITASGKNIAPQNIESMLMIEKYIDQVNIVGDARKYLTAVIVPSFKELQKWADAQGLRFMSLDEMVADSRVIGLIAEIIDRVNLKLAKFENVRKFVLSSIEFTQENDMLTPSLKIRRKAVNKRFREEIERMYAE